MAESFATNLNYPKYLIGNLGSVVRQSRRNKPIDELNENDFLAHRYNYDHKNQKGYIRVSIVDKYDKKNDNKLLSRLIAETYLPLPDGSLNFDQFEVHHIDGDIHNNAVTNLKWVTRQENLQQKNIKYWVRKGYVSENTVYHSRVYIGKRSIAGVARYIDVPKYKLIKLLKEKPYKQNDNGDNIYKIGTHYIIHSVSENNRKTNKKRKF